MRSTECDDSCDGLVVGEELSASGTLQVSRPPQEVLVHAADRLVLWLQLQVRKSWRRRCLAVQLGSPRSYRKILGDSVS